MLSQANQFVHVQRAHFFTSECVDPRNESNIMNSVFLAFNENWDNIG